MQLAAKQSAEGEIISGGGARISVPRRASLQPSATSGLGRLESLLSPGVGAESQDADLPETATQPAQAQRVPASESERARLSARQIKEIKEKCGASGVSLQALEERFGGPLGKVCGDDGQTAEGLKQSIIEEVGVMAKESSP